MTVLKFRTLIYLLFIFPFVLSKSSWKFSQNLDQNHQSENDLPKDNNDKMPRSLSYYASTNTATWLEAFSSCNSLGGRLVTPSNPLSDDALRQYMIQEGIDERDVWTGGRASLPDEQDFIVWYWETYNLGFYWTNFLSSACSTVQADYCVSAYTSRETASWGWCRRRCSESLYYICEFGTPITTTTPAPTTEEPQTEMTTQPPPTEIPSTTILTTTNGYFVCPTPYGFFADPLDCKKYYLCEEGQVTAHKTCPGSHLWNDNMKICDDPSNVDCLISPTTTHSTTEIPPTTTPYLTTTKPPHFLCPSHDGFFADPEDCSKYYVCHGGDVTSHQSCPRYTLWNDTLKKCDDPSNVDCEMIRFY